MKAKTKLTAPVKTPRVRLPRTDATGARIPRHPLLLAIDKAEERGLSARQLALRHLGCTQQALFFWITHARLDRDYLLPPDRVAQLCRVVDMPPYYFRPDCWPTPEWVMPALTTRGAEPPTSARVDSGVS